MKKIVVLFSSVPFLLLLFFVCVLSPLPAETSVIKTSHFDIIYPSESAETAQLLATYADGFADEISLIFDSPLRERIPVYITPAEKNLNAYFTSYLYNRIVVYDALPVDGELSGSHDVMLKVFYHELVHLVTLNIRTPFWQFMSEVFGDFISINDVVTMPLSFLEGVTVSLESRDGQGRLNDPLVLHTLRQAKIDRDFPTFKDAAGARDVYPAGRMSYFFGGGFSEWLQQTYGMEKYAELWKRGGGFNPFLSWTWTRFHQVYGIPIETAWARFRDSIEIPAEIRDEGSPIPGTGTGIICSLASGSGKVVWADGNAGKVFLRDSQGNTRALFDIDGNLSRLSLSDDGTLLLVSSFMASEHSTGETVRLFDLCRNRFTGESWGHLRDAAFVGNGETVCGVETEGQRSSLVAFSRSAPRGASRNARGIVASANGSTRKVLAVAGPGMDLDILFSPVFAGDGKIAFLGSHGRTRDLVFVDMERGGFSKLGLPEGTDFVRQLGVSVTAKGRVLSFCWATKKDFYRYGFYYPESGELILQNENVSGGVFMPVPDQDCTGFYYVSSHLSGDRLMHAALSDTKSTVFRPSIEVDSTLQLAAVSRPDSVPLAEPLQYHPLSWFSRGVVLPFFAVMPRKDDSSIFGPSLTYLTEDPTESVQISVSAAYFAGPAFVDASAEALFRTDVARIDILAKDQVLPAVSKYEPYRQTSSALTFARTNWLDTSWKRIDTILSGSAHWYAPDVESHSSVYETSFDSGSVGSDAQLVFSELLPRFVPGRFFFPVTLTGYSLSADGYFGLVRPDPVSTNLVQGKIFFSTPFIPVSVTLAAASADGLYFTPVSTRYEADCVREYVFDETQYYPSFPEYKGTIHEGVESDLIVSGDAKITPFLLEIQKGVPFLPLYANRLSFVTGYRAAVFGIADTSRTYLDSVYARGSFEASAVIGIFTNLLLSADVEYAYPLRSGSGYVFFTFGAKIPM